MTEMTEGASAPSGFRVFDPQGWGLAISRQQVLANMEAALARGLPTFIGAPGIRSDTLIICGAAPSVKKHVKEIAKHKAKGREVWAVNGVMNYLADRGVIVDRLVLLDSSAIIAPLVTPRPDVKYLVASLCHADTFEKLKGFDVTLWHAGGHGGEEELLKRHGGPWCLVHGGVSATLRCLNLGYLLGFRRFRWYGMDSSFAGAEHHVYATPLNTHIIEIFAEGRAFRTTPEMARQARDFNSLFQTFGDCDLQVIGDGLIPFMARELNKRKANANAKS